MYILNWWCQQSGVKQIFGIIRTLINVIHLVVPIGLIVMTGIDVFTKVLNPDDKEVQKKIMHRAIAAVLVFFVPMLIRVVLKLADIGMGNDASSIDSISECWR